VPHPSFAWVGKQEPSQPAFTVPYDFMNISSSAFCEAATRTFLGCPIQALLGWESKNPSQPDFHVPNPEYSLGNCIERQKDPHRCPCMTAFLLARRVPCTSKVT
jgi:hypothetical protein